MLQRWRRRTTASARTRWRTLGQPAVDCLLPTGDGDKLCNNGRDGNPCQLSFHDLCYKQHWDEIKAFKKCICRHCAVYGRTQALLKYCARPAERAGRRWPAHRVGISRAPRHCSRSCPQEPGRCHTPPQLLARARQVTDYQGGRPLEPAVSRSRCIKTSEPQRPPHRDCLCCPGQTKLLVAGH